MKTRFGSRRSVDDPVRIPTQTDYRLPNNGCDAYDFFSGNNVTFTWFAGFR
jgi:hypothetical protein